VEKTEFLNILQHYASTSVDEAKEIASLRAQYPYSQILQTLSARASKDHGLQHQQRDLQVAAIYASDRALLKELITLQPDEHVHQIVSKHIDADQQVVSTIDSVDMADVIMDDLERLSKLKHTFENLFMDYPKSRKDGKETKEKKEISFQPASAETASPISQESLPKSKKERIIEMAKALNSNPDTVDSLSPKKKRLDKDGNPVDELIAEIQSSKEEIVPDSERQKQQIEIINQFIRIQPSISNQRDRGPSAIGDLMPIKSGEFGDNIVSETLVEILIKQGKKDRAIEVLKKLIWKYPQKKAYFASQIEDLKK
jgi:predicted Zn-dependent protease